MKCKVNPSFLVKWLFLFNFLGMPQPPPYTNEAYAKQAPYNPAYPPPQWNLPSYSYHNNCQWKIIRFPRSARNHHLGFIRMSIEYVVCLCVIVLRSWFIPPRMYIRGRFDIHKYWQKFLLFTIFLRFCSTNLWEVRYFYIHLLEIYSQKIFINPFFFLQKRTEQNTLDNIRITRTKRKYIKLNFV